MDLAEGDELLVLVEEYADEAQGWIFAAKANEAGYVPRHYLELAADDDTDRERQLADENAELANAAWNGDLAKIKSLVKKGAEIDGAFSNGHHSALNGAARNGHAEIVGFLLASGCPDIESRCQAPWSVTPLQ